MFILLHLDFSDFGPARYSKHTKAIGEVKQEESNPHVAEVEFDAGHLLDVLFVLAAGSLCLSVYIFHTKDWTIGLTQGIRSRMMSTAGGCGISRPLSFQMFATCLRIDC
jgi:hypothetical protein